MRSVPPHLLPPPPSNTCPRQPPPRSSHPHSLEHIVGSRTMSSRGQKRHQKLGVLHVVTVDAETADCRLSYWMDHLSHIQSAPPSPLRRYITPAGGVVLISNPWWLEVWLGSRHSNSICHTDLAHTALCQTVSAR